MTGPGPDTATRSRDQLPSLARLRRATAVAGAVAVVLLVAVVLPAERGIDPTGLGRVMGLKAMGDYKMEAARYQAAVAAFAAQRAADSAAASAMPRAASPDSIGATTAEQPPRSPADTLK